MATLNDSQLQVLVSNRQDAHQQRDKCQQPELEDDIIVPLQPEGHIICYCRFLRYIYRDVRRCCLRSRAAQLILLWNFIVAFVFESLLSTDPDSYLLSSIFGPGIKVSSANFAANAFILIFYPLAGYLADVRYGRYWMVTRSLWLMFFSELFLMASVIVVVMYLFAFGEGGRWSQLFYMLFIAAVPSMCGLVSFRANIIQFGVDQLQDFPSEDSIFYIFWYVCTGYGGKAVAKIPFVLAGKLCGDTGFQIIHGAGALLVVVFVLLLGVSLSASDSNRQWFFIDAGARNPYKLVYGVVKFAAKHKNPIRRSAFTYCEDELPSRIDLGKEKYGGPYTTEQVEDVKALLGILLVLASFGPIFALDSATTALYRSTFSLEYYGTCPGSNSSSDSYYITVISRAGALVPFFIVVLIPLYLVLLRPVLYNYIPGTLKRMGLGAILLITSILCNLLIDTFGHTPDTCFLSGDSLGKYKSRLVVNFVMVPNFLNALSYILILSGSYEFICCQCPHAMKGLLIGTLFAIKGFFQLLGVLLTFLPFMKWSPGTSFPSCGFIYYLINIVIGLAGLVVYTVVARRYRYRQRDEPDYTYRYAEEYYDRSDDEPASLRHGQIYSTAPPSYS